MDVLALGRLVLVETLLDLGSYAGVVNCCDGALAGVLGRVPGFGSGTLHLLAGFLHRLTGALSKGGNRESDGQDRRPNNRFGQVHGYFLAVDSMHALRGSDLGTGSVSERDHRGVLCAAGSRRS